MRTIKILGLVVAILGLLTAVIALATEVLKLHNELPSRTQATAQTALPTTTPIEPTATVVVGVSFPLEISVSALGWMSTNIELQPGDQVTIRYVTGAWKAAPDWDLVGPKGDWRYVMSTYRLPNYPLLSLIGRVGDTSPFFVGEGLSFTATVGGELQLGANDIDNMFGDNDGNLIISINVQR